MAQLTKWRSGGFGERGLDRRVCALYGHLKHAASFP
uniref:Uncharacterized protein n=1 Tax=Anguilla anguilla TaxID=7936 RepID=A0A0E9Q3I0_ANGAN